MRTIRTKVYQFSELSKAAKDKAICWFIEILLIGGEWPEDSPYAPAYAKNLTTPWFIGETLFHEHKEQLIADIEANEYEFKADGTRY